MCFGQAETNIWACLTPNRPTINKPSLNSLGVSRVDRKIADGKSSASSDRHYPQSSMPVNILKLRMSSDKSKN